MTKDEQNHEIEKVQRDNMNFSGISNTQPPQEECNCGKGMGVVHYAGCPKASQSPTGVTRQCSRCKEEKPITEFYKYSKSRDGLQYFCKKCRTVSRKTGVNGEPLLYREIYKISEPAHKKYLFDRIKYRLKQWETYKNRKLLFTFEEFSDFLDTTNWLELRQGWIESGYKKGKSPSVDRIDNDGDYELSNIQIITHSENTRKGGNKFKGLRKPVSDNDRTIADEYRNGGNITDLAKKYGITKTKILYCIARTSNNAALITQTREATRAEVFNDISALLEKDYDKTLAKIVDYGIHLIPENTSVTKGDI